MSVKLSIHRTVSVGLGDFLFGLTMLKYFVIINYAHYCLHETVGWV